MPPARDDYGYTQDSCGGLAFETEAQSLDLLDDLPDGDLDDHDALGLCGGDHIGGCFL